MNYRAIIDIIALEAIMNSYFDLPTEYAVLFLPWRQLEPVSAVKSYVRGETTRQIQWVSQNDVIV